MQNRLWSKGGVAAFAAILVIAGCSKDRAGVRSSRDGAADGDRPVGSVKNGHEFTGASALPPAVRSAIEKSEPGALICDVNPAGDSGWSVVVWTDERVRELMIRSDGLVLTNFGEYTEMQDIQRLPEAVSKAAKKAYPKGKIYRVDMPVMGDSTYQVYMLDKGKQFVVEINQEGAALNQRAL